MKNIQTYWINEHIWDCGEDGDGEITMLAFQDLDIKLDIALNVEGGIISEDRVWPEKLLISGGYRKITQREAINLLEDIGVSYDMDGDIILVSDDGCY